MKDLRQKTAFVTGGASGIGFALAEAFLDEGMNVMLADIETPALDAALGRLKAFDNRVRGVRCDTSDRASVADAAKQARDAFGAVHILCNNAGVGNGALTLDATPPAQWDWVLGVNLQGVFNGVAEFLPHMRAHGEPAHIVNTASMAGMLGMPMMGAYCVTKSAVVSMTETLAAELAGTNVGASVLCPGWVRTRIYESGRNRPSSVEVAPSTPLGEARRQEVTALIENGMTPQEVAARVLAAIRDGDLYIFTHSEMRGIAEHRFAAISAAFDKAARFSQDKAAAE